MMRSMNNGEIIAWLKEIRSHAPEPAYQMLYIIASDELPPVRWQKVKTVLENKWHQHYKKGGIIAAFFIGY